jgi:hypothetical protein
VLPTVNNGVCTLVGDVVNNLFKLLGEQIVFILLRSYGLQTIEVGGIKGTSDAGGWRGQSLHQVGNAESIEALAYEVLWAKMMLSNLNILLQIREYSRRLTKEKARCNRFLEHPGKPHQGQRMGDDFDMTYGNFVLTKFSAGLVDAKILEFCQRSGTATAGGRRTRRRARGCSGGRCGRALEALRIPCSDKVSFIEREVTLRRTGIDNSADSTRDTSGFATPAIALQMRC